MGSSWKPTKIYDRAVCETKRHLSEVTHIIIKDRNKNKKDLSIPEEFIDREWKKVKELIKYG